MNKPIKPIPDGMHTVTPHLVCNGAADAIEFYKKAFKPWSWEGYRDQKESSSML